MPLQGDEDTRGIVQGDALRYYGLPLWGALQFNRTISRLLFNGTDQAPIEQDNIENMSGILSVSEMLAYDQWATRQLLPAVLTLTDDRFVHEFGGEMSSVRDQFVHLLSVSDRYRARILREPVPEVDFKSFESPASLTPYAAEIEERLLAMIASLTPARWMEETRLETRRGVFVMTVEQTILQIVNHGTYHRGQVASMLKCHGVEPIDSDIVIWWNRDRD